MQKIALMLAGLAVGGAALAADPVDPMHNYYGNTLLSKHEDGGVYEVYFEPDHSFKVTHEGKIVKQGTYTLDGGKMCMLINNKVDECPPFRIDMKVGESWDAVTPNGHHDLLTLKRGR